MHECFWYVKQLKYTSTKQTVVAAVGFGHFTVASLAEINENVKKNLLKMLPKQVKQIYALQ